MKLNKTIVATVVVCALSTAPQADACEKRGAIGTIRAVLSWGFSPSQAQPTLQSREGQQQAVRRGAIGTIRAVLSRGFSPSQAQPTPQSREG